MASGRQVLVGGFGMGAEACLFQFSKDSRSNGVGWGDFARLREGIAERGMCTGIELGLQNFVFSTGYIELAKLKYLAITA